MTHQGKWPIVHQIDRRVRDQRLHFAAHQVRYTSVLKYFNPESTISVTTCAAGPNSWPTRIAARTFAPDDVPAKRASSRARRRAISFASAVGTATIWSTRLG